MLQWASFVLYRWARAWNMLRTPDPRGIRPVVVFARWVVLYKRRSNVRREFRLLQWLLQRWRRLRPSRRWQGLLVGRVTRQLTDCPARHVYRNR
jgi:hypothetical protein